MRVLEREQVGLPGAWTEWRVEGGTLHITAHLPGEEVVESYDLSGVGEEPVPGSALLPGARFGLLARAWREGEDVVAEVVVWPKPKLPDHG